MKIRRAKIKDAKSIVEVHYDAIHNIAKADYGPQILESWHRGVTENSIEKMRQVLSSDKEEVFVCEDNDRILGFGSMVPDYNEVRAIYVCKSHGNNGIGTNLLQALESRAHKLDLPRLQLQSSITAKNFYLKNGYSPS